MKYMLLVYGDENYLSQDEREACFKESALVAHDINEKGKYIAASPLHPTETATTVRVRDGKRQVTDGPFAETREQLGGYYIVEAADLDDAVDMAARIPGGRWGSVEIRPIVDITEILPD